jgi:hypothetical protein
LEETQELKIVDQSEEKEMNSNMEENKENGEQVISHRVIETLNTSMYL